MNELKPLTPNLLIQPGVVKLNNFEAIKEQCLMVSDYLNTIEVDAEHIKTAKKMVAEARKITDEMSKRRIAVKKEILKDYDLFEKQVKELASIIDAADRRVRDDVKALEEKERQAKKEEIQNIWNLRIDHYECRVIPDLFNKWFKESHLNKSVSMNKVEMDMLNFLQSTEQSFKTIQSMDDADIIMRHFIQTMDLTSAIALMHEERSKKEETKKILNTVKQEKEPVAVFVVAGEKDITFTRLFLSQNGINYTEREA